MLDILLLFLGIKSWYVDFYPIKKWSLKKKSRRSLKNNKAVNTLNLIDDETPSPRMSAYRINKYKQLTLKYKLVYTAYSIYSFIILLLLTVQPIYAIYRYSEDVTNLKFLSSFLSHINIPLIYMWGKVYFRSDHLERELKNKKLKTVMISFFAAFSIFVNFLDVSSFYNSYHWMDLLNSKPIFFLLIIIEWIYSRLILFLYAFSFMFTMERHIAKFKSFITALKSNELQWLDDSPLAAIIKEVVIIRKSIERTISFYNNIISITTLLGGTSLGIFIRSVIPDVEETGNDISIEAHDRYLVHPGIAFIFCQIALFIYMTRYTIQRDRLLRYIKSIEFINKFLSRIPDEKIYKKSKQNLNVVMLNIADSSSTSIDWIILGNILSDKWLDFTILGISTSDGGLIKKCAAMGSAFLFIANSLQNEN